VPPARQRKNHRPELTELTAFQHAQHVTERKKVWVAMHPETKHGGAPAVVEGKGGMGKLKWKKSKDCTVQSFGDGQSPDAFVKETARVTQSHPSTVSRSA
jgi:hypothetical protein